jgi:hypothetical protein
VKTNPPALSILDSEWGTLSGWIEIELMRLHAGDISEVQPDIPSFRGRDDWFTPEVQRELALILKGVRQVPEGILRDFFMLAFSGIVRKASNASERAGRIFKEIGKVLPRPWHLMQQRVKRMRAGIEDFHSRVNGIERPSVSVGDAKDTQLPRQKYGLVFFHPPYFALYKYSSDVLRFELEWLGIDRKEIVRGEIRDGFKTTRSEDVEPFLDDIGAVLQEGRRIIHPQGAMVVVSNNSTLRKQPLPIITGIQEQATKAQFRLARHCIRTVRFAQASYHRSADEEINTPRDHILFFEPI